MIDPCCAEPYLIDQDLRGESSCELHQRLQPGFNHDRIKGLDAGRYHWLNHDRRWCRWRRRWGSSCWLSIRRACHSARTLSSGLAFGVLEVFKPGGNSFQSAASRMSVLFARQGPKCVPFDNGRKGVQRRMVLWRHGQYVWVSGAGVTRSTRRVRSRSPPPYQLRPDYAAITCIASTQKYLCFYQLDFLQPKHSDRRLVVSHILLLSSYLGLLFCLPTSLTFSFVLPRTLQLPL